MRLEKISNLDVASTIAAVAGIEMKSDMCLSRFSGRMDIHEVPSLTAVSF